jgi:glycosyltransferase involved in cell wall biosynthesis
MKIVVISINNIYVEAGATSNRWRAMVEGLAKHGAKVHLVFLGGFSSQKEFDQYGVEGEIDNNISYFYSNTRLTKSLNGRRLNKYLLTLYIHLNNVFNIKKYLLGKEFDYVFVMPKLDCFRVYDSLILKSTFKHVKLILELNEFQDVMNDHSTNPLQTYRNNIELKYLTKVILPRVNVCITMTKILETYYRKFTNKNSDIVYYHLPMSVDLSRFELVDDNVEYIKPYIAYTGSSSFSKDGIDVLIKSFEKVANTFKDLRLYIAAFYEIDGGRMMQLIEKSEFKDRIIYLGSIERDKIPVLLKGAEMLVMPRPDSRQAQGGFPTKLGEYLASSNPVCVTRVGEIPNYLEHKKSAYLANPSDVDSFAETLIDALSNKKEAFEIGLNGRKVAENYFNKDKQGAELFDFLEKQMK